MIRSHLTAFGVGAGLALLAAGAFALIAPKIAEAEKFGEGVHVVNIGGGDRGSFHLKENAIEIEATWNGKFEFAAQGRSLSSLKGRLEIETGKDGAARKVEFSSRDGEVTKQVYVAGKSLPPGPEADGVAADVLQLFARSSSVNAEGRVKALLAEGGKEAAIEEIANLVGGHATGAYIEALAHAAPLTSADVSALAARAAAVESDYSKRTAIVALLNVKDIDQSAAAEILRAAKAIESDHELRLIVEKLTEKPLGDRQLDTVVSLIEGIDGDHEVRLSIAALLKSGNVSDDAAAKALELAADSIDGDYELRLAVEAAGERVRNEAVGAAAIDAIGSLDGAHDRRLAIEAIADLLGAQSSNWKPLIAAAAAIDGDYERRLAIEKIASSAPDEPDIRAALRKAAESIPSDHERNLALRALD